MDDSGPRFISVGASSMNTEERLKELGTTDEIAQLVRAFMK
jgi:hypothetical protein